MACENIKPTKPSVPYSTLTACQKLAVCEEALMSLASGKQKVTVRHGDYWVEYGVGSVAFLERERARLTRLCSLENGINPHRAITIGRPTCR